MHEYDGLLAQARQLAEDRYPDASVQKKAAFADSVVELLLDPNGPIFGPITDAPDNVQKRSIALTTIPTM